MVILSWATVLEPLLNNLLITSTFPPVWVQLQLVLEITTPAPSLTTNPLIAGGPMLQGDWALTTQRTPTKPHPFTSTCPPAGLPLRYLWENSTPASSLTTNPVLAGDKVSTGSWAMVEPAIKTHLFWFRAATHGITRRTCHQAPLNLGKMWL